MRDYNWYMIDGILTKVDKSIEQAYIKDIPFNRRFRINSSFIPDSVTESWYVMNDGRRETFSIIYSLTFADEFIPGIACYRERHFHEWGVTPVCFRHINVPKEWFRDDIVLLPDYIKEVCKNV